MSRLYDCYGGPGTSKEACGSCDVCLRMRILELESERNALKAWKESAMAIEREWDEQALAFMLGVPLGQSVRMGIAEKVPKIIARVKRLEEALEFGVGANRAKELMGDNHIGDTTELMKRTKEVPCPDCYGGHFRPCNICGDSGVALLRTEAKESKP